MTQQGEHKNARTWKVVLSVLSQGGKPINKPSQTESPCRCLAGIQDSFNSTLLPVCFLASLPDLWCLAIYRCIFQAGLCFEGMGWGQERRGLNFRIWEAINGRTQEISGLARSASDKGQLLATALLQSPFRDKCPWRSFLFCLIQRRVQQGHRCSSSYYYLVFLLNYFMHFFASLLRAI